MGISITFFTLLEHYGIISIKKTAVWILLSEIFRTTAFLIYIFITLIFVILVTIILVFITLAFIIPVYH